MGYRKHDFFSSYGYGVLLIVIGFCLIKISIRYFDKKNSEGLDFNLRFWAGGIGFILMGFTIILLRILELFGVNIKW